MIDLKIFEKDTPCESIGFWTKDSLSVQIDDGHFFVRKNEVYGGSRKGTTFNFIYDLFEYYEEDNCLRFIDKHDIVLEIYL